MRKTIGREVGTELGNKILTDLKTVFSQIETAVDQNKTVAKDLLDKGHTLWEQAKTLGGQVWQSAATVFGVHHIHFQIHAINRFPMKGIGKRTAEEKRLLWEGLQTLSQHLSEDLKKIFGNVGSKFTAFNQYLVDLFHKEVQAAKPAVDNVKQLATNFLDATKEKSAKVVSEAKEFFQPYHLGELWGQIECTYNHVVKNAPATCH